VRSVCNGKDTVVISLVYVNEIQTVFYSVPDPIRIRSNSDASGSMRSGNIQIRIRIHVTD